MLQALNKVKTGKAPDFSEVSLVLIVASEGVGIQMMTEICQIVLDGFGMPVEWALSIVVPIFKGKVTSGTAAVNLLEHGMKVVERVLENRLHGIMSAVEMQFGFMSEV